MPSPMGKRVEPIISDDLKKKIQAAIKSKENRIKKGTKKENISTVSKFEKNIKFININKK